MLVYGDLPTQLKHPKPQFEQYFKLKIQKRSKWWQVLILKIEI